MGNKMKLRKNVAISNSVWLFITSTKGVKSGYGKMQNYMYWDYLIL
jgi:hypothetical protein